MADVLLANTDGTVLVGDDGAALVALSLPDGPPVPTFTEANFQAATLVSLPSGPVWPKDLDSIQAKVALGLAAAYARLSSRAGALLQDSPTGVLYERLPEWEATLGLPDPCAGSSPSIQQRQRSVNTAIAARGGQSINYAMALLAALGRTGEAIEYAPARVDHWSPEEPLYGPEWANAWEILVNAVPLGSEDTAAIDDVVRCTLVRMCPAHTKLLLSFVTLDFSPADFSGDFAGGQS